MNSSNPPRVAQWLLQRWASSPSGNPSWVTCSSNATAAGPRRYWRQTTNAILSSLVAEVWQHKVLSISVAAFRTYLPYIYMVTLWPGGWRGSMAGGIRTSSTQDGAGW